MLSTYYTGRLDDGGAVRITVAQDRIVSVDSCPESDDLPWILPVLVDLQHNGSVGRRYDHWAAWQEGDIQAVATHLRQHGIGRCLVTFTTYDYDGLRASASRYNEVVSRDHDLATLFTGIFHEGCFISPHDGWRGAHAARWVRRPDYDLVAGLDRASGGRVLAVNVAPEEPGGLEFVARAIAAGKIVSLGHGAPDADTVSRAIERGARWVTHFGNGAPPLIHRHNNPFWAYLADPRLKLGLICDGFHLPRELVQTVIACKPPGGWFPVSDSSGYAGCPPGSYATAAGDGVVIESTGRIHLDNSEILCGAWFQIDRAVEFLTTDIGLPWRDAWRCCSTIPAAALGLELPVPAAGAEASFVLARWEDGLVLEQCVHLGRPYLVPGGNVRPRDPALVSRDNRENTSCPRPPRHGGPHKESHESE